MVNLEQGDSLSGVCGVAFGRPVAPDRPGVLRREPLGEIHPPVLHVVLLQPGVVHDWGVAAAPIIVEAPGRPIVACISNTGSRHQNQLCWAEGIPPEHGIQGRAPNQPEGKLPVNTSASSSELEPRHTISMALIFFLKPPIKPGRRHQKKTALSNQGGKYAAMPQLSQPR